MPENRTAGACLFCRNITRSERYSSSFLTESFGACSITFAANGRIFDVIGRAVTRERERRDELAPRAGGTHVSG